MSDDSTKLVQTIVERLELGEQARIEAEVAKVDREAAEQEKRLKIEGRLVETGQHVRELIVEYERKRFSRRSRWLGGRIMQMTYAIEPGLTEMIRKLDILSEGVTDPDELKELSRRNSYDFQPTLTTPLLLVEAGPLDGAHRFELGWKFRLKEGSHAEGSQLGWPAYSYRRSPLYIYRAAREIHSGEEADELAYIMLFPGDMRTQKEPELKSFTDGTEDDELVLAGKDAHLHVLGLMQEGIKELSFRRSKR